MGGRGGTVAGRGVQGTRVIFCIWLFSVFGYFLSDRFCDLRENGPASIPSLAETQV